jgi:SAM-dependent methyltransferase
MTGASYPNSFFDEQRGGSIASARHVVPIVMELIQPRSVVDVGCGTGTWLSVFAEHQVVDFIGLDGDYVDRSQLLIPEDRFLACDLVDPVKLGRRFDLAVSVEVAEHLPEDSAGTIVSSLTQLAPIVLFSAAVPGQGGFRHVNEQWPSYWVSRFAEHNFVLVDAIRPRIWENRSVAWWYVQNTLLFVSIDEFQAQARLRTESNSRPAMIDLVHPRMYEGLLRGSKELSARRLLAMLPAAVGRSISWRVRHVR